MTFQATIVQEKLEEAGFDAKLAFGLTAVLERNVVAEAENRFVTREFLDARLEKLRAELKSDNAELKSELKSDIAGLKAGLAELKGGLEATKAQQAADTATIRGELTSGLAALRAEMIKWFVGIMCGTALAVLLGLLRFVR